MEEVFDLLAAESVELEQAPRPGDDPLDARGLPAGDSGDVYLDGLTTSDLRANWSLVAIARQWDSFAFLPPCLGVPRWVNLLKKPVNVDCI
jgi:hypothetical protein